MPPPREYTVGSGAWAINQTVLGSPFTVTRPNNVLGYVSGDIYGDAADARLSVTVPAIPAGSRAPYFLNLLFCVVHSRPIADPDLSLQLLPFLAQPATVQGDRTQIALSDADILQLPAQSAIGGAANPTFIQFNAQNRQLNNAAGLAGRRWTHGTLILQNGVLMPGFTLWFYLMQTGAAYAPLALETLTFFPVFSYLLSRTRTS